MVQYDFNKIVQNIKAANYAHNQKIRLSGITYNQISEYQKSALIEKQLFERMDTTKIKLPISKGEQKMDTTKIKLPISKGEQKMVKEKRKYVKWTDEEKKILLEANESEMNAKDTLELLPNRSASNIYTQLSKVLKVKCKIKGLAAIISKEYKERKRQKLKDNKGIELSQDSHKIISTEDYNISSSNEENIETNKSQDISESYEYMIKIEANDFSIKRNISQEKVSRIVQIILEN